MRRDFVIVLFTFHLKQGLKYYNITLFSRLSLCIHLWALAVDLSAFVQYLAWPRADLSLVHLWATKTYSGFAQAECFWEVKEYPCPEVLHGPFLTDCYSWISYHFPLTRTAGSVCYSNTRGFSCQQQLLLVKKELLFIKRLVFSSETRAVGGPSRAKAYSSICVFGSGREEGQEPLSCCFLLKCRREGQGSLSSLPFVNMPFPLAFCFPRLTGDGTKQPAPARDFWISSGRVDVLDWKGRIVSMVIFVFPVKAHRPFHSRPLWAVILTPIKLKDWQNLT